MTEKPAKPVTRRVRPAKPKLKRRKPSHEEISERAYFIHLEEGRRDDLGNWLRAERELTAA
jgi:hypothetical protein